MLRRFNKLDVFTRNILVVFAGTTSVNFINFLFQLLIAHKLTPENFAAFNSLVALFIIISFAFGTIQTVIAKYAAEFSAAGSLNKVKFFYSDLLKKTSVIVLVTQVITLIFFPRLFTALKINSPLTCVAFSVIFSTMWFLPVFLGFIQGFELFKEQSVVTIIGGLLKLVLGFALVSLGFNVAGAMIALLISQIICFIIFFFFLKEFLIFKADHLDINYKEMFIFSLPVLVCTFSYSILIGSDMILVKYFFSPQDSGTYSLAQMVGKVFLFLPSAITIAMFPRINKLNAQKMDTLRTLKKSIFYMSVLCGFAFVCYFMAPSFFFKILTGKVNSESILLGKLFSFSMTLYSLVMVMMCYFFSLKDFRFMKYLVMLTFLQTFGIIFFHANLLMVQFILCASSFMLFLILLLLLRKKV
ncbi:MAG: oligosaccharide flippase family protein [Candidatus Omnitrophica bacterium]|nr:oligosaccharide flippase family protein [Candidatus Omnitrophota bacterium]